MASALFTLADGAGSATAVGGSSQAVGLNVTAGNTVNGQLTDIVGVTSYSVRSIWNNAGLSDTGIVFTVNQATGAWSFPAGATEGVAYIIETTIINASSTPTVSVSRAGVYVSAQGAARVPFPTTAYTQLQLVNLMSQVASLAVMSDPNVCFITNASTTNGQGSGGPTIVAICSLVCRGSGIFDYVVSAAQPAAAAAEVVTWTLTSQTGSAAMALTGSTVAAGSGGTALGLGGQVASAAAGTGIVITTGGGGELTYNSQAGTVGTAAVGSAFSSVGTLQNSVSATAVTPFTRGNNVLLCLKVTNSATNRVISNINMSLKERLFA